MPHGNNSTYHYKKGEPWEDQAFIAQDSFPILKSAEQIAREQDSLRQFYEPYFLIDEDILEEVGKKFKKVITVENGVRQGGLGSAVLEWMNDHGYAPKVTRLGLPDKFVEHGTVKELQHIVGIDEEGIKKAILEA
jgi:1-deoxy-D-xylulose-5-phosphate synthase